MPLSPLVCSTDNNGTRQGARVAQKLIVSNKLKEQWSTVNPGLFVNEYDDGVKDGARKLALVLSTDNNTRPLKLGHSVFSFSLYSIAHDDEDWCMK